MRREDFTALMRGRSGMRWLALGMKKGPKGRNVVMVRKVIDEAKSEEVQEDRKCGTLGRRDEPT